MRPIQSTLISTGPLVKHKQRGPRAKRAAQRRGYSIPLGGRTAPAAEDRISESRRISHRGHREIILIMTPISFPLVLVLQLGHWTLMLDIGYSL